MDQELADVHHYLSSKYLHVSNEWLEGCVNFFRTENSGGYGRAQLEEFVLEQWKLADLRDMGEACLPQNLAAKVKIMLPGKYSVQVESMVDIGAPCYSQLQKIRRVTTENLEVSETKPQTWEPRPTRMFRLMLCDGVQEIMGIEYRPIRKLDQTLIPGCKVLVIGPVECRKGVILLQEHNLQIIGGEVDSMLVPNALENMLARTLHLEENPQPYMNGLTPPEVPTSAQLTVQSIAVNTSTRPATTMHPLTINTPIRPPVINAPIRPPTVNTPIRPPAVSTSMYPPACNKLIQPAANNILQPNRPVAQVAPMATNHFDDDDDILQCAELDDIEKRFQQEMDDIPDDMIIDDEVGFPDTVSRDWNVGSSKAVTSGRTVTRVFPPTYTRSCDSHDLGQLKNNNCDTSVSNCVSSVKRTNVISEAANNKLNSQKNSLNSQKSGINRTFMKFGTDSFNDLDDFEVSDFNYAQYSSKTSTSTVNPSVHISDLLEQDDELLLDISSQDLDASVLPSQDVQTHKSKNVSNSKLSTKKESVKVCKKPLQRNQSKITSFINKSQVGTNSFSGRNEAAAKKPVVPPAALKRPPSPLKSKTSAYQQEKFLERKKHKSLDEVATSSRTVVSENHDKNFDAASDFRSIHTLSKLRSKVDYDVRDFVTSRGTENSVGYRDASVTSVVLPAMEHCPFVYLSQLQSLSRTSVVTFTVKAFVLTLVSQLVLKKEGWHLLCKINDGSMVMQVQFSSEVLEKLIGYTPAEMRVLRKQMATNPTIKEKVKGSLLDAQKKLVNLNCLLDVTFSPDSDVPVVTAISEVNKEHVELLNRRLQVLSKAAGLEGGGM